MLVIISTFHQYDNYGSRLQNFALSHAIQTFGVPSVTLAASSIKEDLYDRIKKILSLLPAVCKRQKKWVNERKKSIAFHQFNERLRIKKIRYKNLNRFQSDIIAIAGSDQIWSPAHIRRCPKDAALYFLRFVQKENRFAYAPSFGTESIPEELKDKYRNYIRGFHRLSVREPAGQKIIRDLTGREAPVLPDPTFLLSRKDWKTISDKCKQKAPTFNYLLTYFLSEQSGLLWEDILQYARTNKLQILRIAGNSYIKSELFPSPDEFVALVAGAKAVFTDSYHGCVFSIIMQSPFVVFRRTDVGQFSRIAALLDKYALNQAFYDQENPKSDFAKIINSLNLLQAEKIMAVERQKGIDYLKMILNSQNT